MKKKTWNTILNIMISICLIAVIILGIYIGLSATGNEEKLNDFYSIINKITPKSYKNTVITKENYEEVMNKANDKLKDKDEQYYLIYSVFYHIAEDGFSNLIALGQDEDLMYKNVYGKTVGELITEGKKMMKEKNITVEEYKNSLENFAEKNNKEQ